MAEEALFRHGDPLMIDHTPSAAVDAGDIVIVGNTAGLTCIVAHRNVANGELAGFAAFGGVYHCMVASTYAAGTKVYKPGANAILTTTSTNNALFGYTLQTAGAANAVVEVLHMPFV
jgi:predicted RecA/RadA family phage recombinase